MRCERLALASLNIAFLHSQKEWQCGQVNSDIADAQQKIRAADHIIFFFPLWQGTIPALMKAFLEQTLRPDFVDRKGQAALRGKTCTMVVTMGMPAWVYCWIFGGHGLKYVKWNIFKLCGMRSVNIGLIGSVEGLTDKARLAWVDKMYRWGMRAK